jgi:hypothetical protein
MAGKVDKKRSDSRAKSTTKKEKKEKKEGPKGKRNAYMFYSAEVRNAIKEELIAKAGGDADEVKGADITAEVSGRYKALHEKEMKKYKDLADKDKARFEKQSTEFEKKGYWIDEETGEKVEPKKKKVVENDDSSDEEDAKENNAKKGNKTDTKKTDTKKNDAKKNDTKKNDTKKDTKKNNKKTVDDDEDDD